jgi:predicted ester cyclase
MARHCLVLKTHAACAGSDSDQAQIAARRVDVNLKDLVESFYADIWNRGDLSFVPKLLRDGFTFRGSLGTERKGHGEFTAYVSMVRGALDDYRCEILDLVTDDLRAFARMRFSGVHTGEFLGYAPSGKRIEWMGAALFTAAKDGRIADLWVLGDIQALTSQLRVNAET